MDNGNKARGDQQMDNIHDIEDCAVNDCFIHTCTKFCMASQSYMHAFNRVI